MMGAWQLPRILTCTGITTACSGLTGGGTSVFIDQPDYQRGTANVVGRPVHSGQVCQGGTTCVATGQDRRALIQIAEKNDRRTILPPVIHGGLSTSRLKCP